MDVRKVIGAVVVAAGVGGYLPGVPGLIGGADPIEDPPEDLALTDDAPVERPPAPPVAEMSDTQPASFDDGLVRLIVTPTADAAGWLPVTEAESTPDPDNPDNADDPDNAETAAEADSDERSAEATPTPETAATDPDPDADVAAAEGDGILPRPQRVVPEIPFDPTIDQTTIDPRLLDLLAISAILTFDEFDRPWAEWSDGTRLPLWSLEEWPLDLLIALNLVDDPDAPPPGTDADDPAAAVTPEPESAPEPEAEPEPEPVVSVGHPVMDAIAATAGVDSVRSVGDGSFAVVLEDPALLDDFPVEVVDDTLMAISAEPYEIYQWALDNTGDNLDGVSGAPPQHPDADVDGTEARTAATGSGVVVAVVDSGVDFSHPDLAPNRWHNDDEVCDNGLDDDANGFVDDCHGWDFAYEDNTPWNPGAHAHGTHVAGIIGAADNGEGVVGVAPDVQLMDLNVGAITASGQPGITTTAVARAIRYAADNGADIINLSLGTPPGSPRQGSLPVEEAIRHAETRGVLVVAAAGNDGTNLDLAPGWPASYEFSNMITVGASTPTDSRAGFSNYGSVVDVFAPGVLVLSSMPGGQLSFMSGTSQATPVVVASAALALEASPGRTPGQLREALVASADRHEVLAPFVSNGTRVNAGAVLGVTDNRHGISDVSVEATGLVGLGDSEPFTLGLTIAMPDDHPTDPLEWEMTLLALGDDANHGVVDLPVAVGDTSTRTDARGAVGLGLSSSGAVDLDLALPAGDYALVLEAVPDDDPTSRIGDARVVRFTVAATPDPTDPTPPPAGDGDGDDEGGGTGTPDDPSDPDDSTGPTGPTPAEPPTGGAPATGPADGGQTPDAGGPPTDPGSTSPGDAPPPSGGGTGTTPPPGGGSGGGAGSSDPGTPPGSDPGSTTPSPTDPSIPAPVPGTPTVPGESDSGDDPTGGQDTTGDWSIRSISPREGLVGVNNVVELRGSFPRPVYVWFGDSPGTVLLQTPDVLVVLTPATPTAGTVNVELRQTGAGSVATMINGFTFVDPFGTDPDPTPPPGNGGATPVDQPPTDVEPPADGGDGSANGRRPDFGDRGPGNCGVDARSGDNGEVTDCPDGPTGGGGEPSPNQPPTDPPTTDPAPTPTPVEPIGGGPGQPVDGDPVGSNRQPRLGMATDIEALSSGLSGVRVMSGDPSPTASTCSSSPCRLD